MTRAEYEIQIIKEEMERVEHEYSSLERRCKDCSECDCGSCELKFELDGVSDYYNELIDQINELGGSYDN